MSKHLVLVGAGHAHMTVMSGIGDFIKAGHRVSVIGPSPHHYYSGMGPGMLGGTYAPDDIRFAVRDMVESRGGRFVLDHVERAEPAKNILRLSSGAVVEYDVVSFNAGSQVPVERQENWADVYTVKPIENLWAARTRIRELLDDPSRDRVRVAVVGGGPAALEVAGNAWATGLGRPRPPEVVVLAGRRFLSPLPDKARALCLKSLEKRGIKVMENGYAASVESGLVHLDNGEKIHCEVVLVATGVRPTPIFEPSGLPAGPDGGLAVNEFLQSTGFTNVFGGGDCIHFQDRPLDKVGVYAVRQNPVLRHNLMAALEGKTLKPFDPGGPYLLIFNLGDGRGMFWKNNLIFGGRLAFRLKDHIDRKFMRRFKD